jgi:glycosyltransferase involved in cell wall biosynthesis
VPHAVGCPTLLFQHNVEAMIWKRHYQAQTNPIKKSYLYNQWRKARRFEYASCRRFDYVVGVSRDDCATMRRDYGIENVADVPTGVDTDYFRPRGHERREPRNLVFTGSMDWLPNQDAVLYFADRIIPLIKRLVPDVTLTVVGRNPYPGLIELSKRDPSITVTGRVDDVRPYIERAGAYIVPLRIGGGTRLKIYEAMAMEKAIISTSIGAEGLPVRDGEELLLADTPEAFAAAVVRTITDEAFTRELGARAGRAVERCGWNRAAERFAEICARVARRPALEVTADLQQDLQMVS